MIKIFHIALREFVTTVFTKAFLLSMILPPVLIGAVLVLMPILMNKASPKVEGHIAVIDQTGVVASKLESAFTAEEMSKRLSSKSKAAMDEAPIPEDLKKQAQAQTDMQAKMMNRTSLRVVVLDPSTELELAKKPILESAGREKDAGGTDPRLALAVIPKESVSPQSGKPFGTFEIFTAQRLDPEVTGDISDQVSRAIVDARILAGGLNVDQVRAMIDRPKAISKAVTAQGEKKTNDAAAFLIPGAFMMLLWISVFTCGNQLLTTTIEEKSSRVMEVLLSAVSPMQLMTGKIIGQMGVGILILGAYGSVGIAGLVVASMMHLVDPINFLYLAIYFAIAFFLIASIMAAVGSAVSDIREAQSLLGPIMMVLIIPMMLWLPIMRNPNSMFAQICSFVPPISPFIMVLRLAGPEPIPTFQIVASIVVGFIYVGVFLWGTAKIFRIGVLMYGKPPNFRTMFKWIRMA